MEKEFEKIINSAKTFSLSSEEKISIINKVSDFMQENPHTLKYIETPYYQQVLSIFYKYKSVMAVLVLVLVFGGGTSFAANFALPGDFLYPVKIHVNETLKSALSFGASSDAKVETEEAETRLEEADQLSKKGEINAETKEQLEENFKSHEGKVKKLSQEIRVGGDVEAATKVDSDFEDVLRAHGDTLVNIGINQEKDNREDIQDDQKNVQSNNSIDLEL